MKHTQYIQIEENIIQLFIFSHQNYGVHIIHFVQQNNIQDDTMTQISIN